MNSEEPRAEPGGAGRGTDNRLYSISWEIRSQEQMIYMAAKRHQLGLTPPHAHTRKTLN
jgi:hypothetical protein